MPRVWRPPASNGALSGPSDGATRVRGAAPHTRLPSLIHSAPACLTCAHRWSLSQEPVDLASLHAVFDPELSAISSDISSTELASSVTAISERTSAAGDAGGSVAPSPQLEWRVLASGVLAARLSNDGWIDAKGKRRCPHGFSSSQAGDAPRPRCRRPHRRRRRCLSGSRGPSQIYSWTAHRNPRPRRCACSSAAGLTRRHASPPPWSPPLYFAALATQTPRVRLEPAGVEALELPGTGGALWIDVNGVARCRHGFSRSALERGRARAADGSIWRCSCSTRGMRRRGLHNESRRRRRGGQREPIPCHATQPMPPPPSPRPGQNEGGVGGFGRTHRGLADLSAEPE